MIGEALVEGHQVVWKVAEGCRARQECHPPVGGKRRQRAGEPLIGRPAVDARILTRVPRQQRAARLGLLIAKHYARTRGGRGGCGRKPGGTCTDDQHIAVGIAGRIAIRICQTGRHPEARG